MVAMETSNLMDRERWCQNVFQMKFGKIHQNLEIIALKLARAPKAAPSPGLDRVKAGITYKRDTVKPLLSGPPITRIDTLY